MRRGSKAAAIAKISRPIKKFCISLGEGREKFIEAHHWNDLSTGIRFYEYKEGETQVIAVFNTWEYVHEIPTPRQDSISSV